MYDKLPNEIISYIYEYDSTYYPIMRECFKYISKYKIYTHDNIITIFYIYNPEDLNLHMTDSIDNPSYICTSFQIKYDQFENIKKIYNLKRKFNFFLKFDINNYFF